MSRIDEESRSCLCGVTLTVESSELSPLEVDPVGIRLSETDCSVVFPSPLPTAGICRAEADADETNPPRLTVLCDPGLDVSRNCKSVIIESPASFVNINFCGVCRKSESVASVSCTGAFPMLTPAKFLEFIC